MDVNNAAPIWLSLLLSPCKVLTPSANSLAILPWHVGLGPSFRKSPTICGLSCSKLGCSFSQILENIRLQSCEGLSLPFLSNWYLGISFPLALQAFFSQNLTGDCSNLIGCILTNQLPFQVSRTPGIVLWKRNLIS